MRYLLCLILFLFVSCTCPSSQEPEDTKQAPPVLSSQPETLGVHDEPFFGVATEEYWDLPELAVLEPVEFSWYWVMSIGLNDILITVESEEPYLEVEVFSGERTVAYGELVSSNPSVVECLLENPKTGFFLIVVAREPGATSDIGFSARTVSE